MVSLTDTGNTEM